jgi:hypothetical protein
MNNFFNSLIRRPNADSIEYASGSKVSFDITREALVTGEAVILAPFACTVASIEEKHEVLSTAVGTLDIVDGAVAMLGATKIDLAGIVDTIQAPAVSGAIVSAGDVLKLAVTGTPVALAGVRIVVTLQMI